MPQNKIVILILLQCILQATAARTMAADLNHSYDKMLSESRMYQEQFRSRATRLCAEIRASCEREEQEEGRVISLERPVQLYSKTGYHITKASMLRAHEPFTLLGKLRGYYRIKTRDGKKVLLARRDFQQHFHSRCRMEYNKCINGEQ